MNESKEKINLIFENLKKSPNFSFFLSDKNTQPLNLDKINHKIISGSYLNIDSLFFDLNRLWNSYFVNYYNKRDYNNIKKVVEISQMTEKLYLSKNNDKNGNKKTNFKIRNKVGKFTKEDKTNLIYKVMALTPEQMKNIIEILSDIKPNEKNHSFDFNVYDLSEENLLKLEEYADKCLKLI